MLILGWIMVWESVGMLNHGVTFNLASANVYSPVVFVLILHINFPSLLKFIFSTKIHLNLYIADTVSSENLLILCFFICISWCQKLFPWGVEYGHLQCYF